MPRILSNSASQPQTSHAKARRTAKRLGGLFDTPTTPFYSPHESDFFLNFGFGLRSSRRARAPASVIRVLAISPAQLTHSGIEVAPLHMGFGCMNKGSFGELLKRERELREVTLNEVTVATRIPPRFLEAFEREDWEKLPGGVFNRGFVRAIARYLGLDEENLLSEYDLAYGEKLAAMPAVVENPIPTPPKVDDCSRGYCHFDTRRRPDLGLDPRLAQVRGASRRETRAAATTTASATPQRRLNQHRHPPRHGGNEHLASHAAAPGSERQHSRRKLPPQPQPPLQPSASTSPSRLSAQTRVRVVADGRVVLDLRLPSGATRHFSAKNQFTVSASHPAAVLLEMNGQAMPPLTSAGPSGTMVLSQKDLRQAPSGNAQR